MTQKDIHYTGGVVAESDGVRFDTQARLKAIGEAADGVYKAFNSGQIDVKAFDAQMNRLENDRAAVAQAKRNTKAAQKWAGSADSAEQWQANGGAPRRSDGSVKGKNLSPMDVPQSELRNMFEAIQHKVPYRTQIGLKGFSDGGGIGFKTSGSPVTEGAPYPSGLLPPVNVPGLTQELPYEPDRLADHIPTIALESPSIEYLRHTGDTNSAASVNPVLETGVKSDLGQQWGTATAIPIKFAALSSASMESLQDWSFFQSWIPRELQRALVDLESNQIANGTGATGSLPGMTGFFNTSGTLTRSFVGGYDITGLDTLIKAVNDIRVGPAFGKASVIALHPSTWTFLKLSKTTTDAYVLSEMDPNAIGAVSSLWGVPIVESTMIPEGSALVADMDQAARYFVRQGLTLDTNIYGDSEWQTNTVSFRCEMRSVLAVLRPQAINLVTGLGYSNAS
jgi:hypothetical protein